MKVIVFFFDSSSFIRLTTYFWGLFYLYEFLISVLKEIKINFSLYLTNFLFFTALQPQNCEK